MPGRTLIRQGGFLEGDVEKFDALFFGISPREAACLDPQQRFLLEVAWEALEDAGLVTEKLAGSDTGVYIGGFTLDSLLLQLDSTNLDLIGPHTATGISMGMLANRISYIFDLRGPSVSMDTACSSSLVAFHYACQDLWSGRCSLALAGGVNLMTNPAFPIAMSKGNFLSPDARCKAFDARANGYARGEGVGVAVLKPLSRAQEDGDHVHALVRATGVNQDGRTKGITVPNGAAQEALIRQVYRDAGVRPDEVCYVETHGTGTLVGDVTEARALGHALGQSRAPGNPCVMGSVKTNIGHLEAAAGIAGIIKAALCLEHRRIPPHLHQQTANPDIPFEELGLRLPRGLEPLPSNGDTPPYISVNSFGYGGTNAHALLQAGPLESAAAEAADEAPAAHLVPLSARSPGALRELALACLERLRGREAAPPLHDFCYSLSLRRDHHDHRLAVVAETPEGVAEGLAAFLAEEPLRGVAAGHASAGEPIRPVFVLTGMGPQWWGMGRELWRDEPVFRQAIEEADQAFQRCSGWSILDHMLAGEESSLMTANWVAQPANFVLQIGLVALWRSWGVHPAAVVGHSVGEVPAAYVAGALDLDEAARVSFERSRVQQKAAGAGGMLAVGLPGSEAAALLAGYEGRVDVAAINSPSSVTLAGELEALEEIAAVLQSRGVFHRALKLEVAYHSPQMEPLRSELLDVLGGLRPRAPRIPLYSTVTGRKLSEAAHDASYWWRNVRQSVRFAEAVEAICEDGLQVFLEIGPHPVLGASIREVLARRGAEGITLASLDRKEPERASLLNALAALYTLGAPVGWSGLFPAGGRFVPLPRYPWQGESYSWEPETAARFRRGSGGYALPGERALTPQPCWEVDLTAGLMPYLKDHVVQGVVVLPGAAYVDAALAAQRQVSGGASSVLEEVRFHKALIVSEHDKVTLRLEIDERSRSFSLLGRSAGREAEWTLHTTGKLSGRRPAAAPGLDLAAIRARCPETIAAEDLYARLHATGLQLGSTFRGIHRLWRQPGEALAEIALHPSLASDAAESPLYPTLLDCGFQTLVATVDPGLHSRSGVFVPVEIARVALHGRPGARLWSHARLIRCSAESIEGEIVMCDESGTVVAEVRGLCCRSLGAGPSRSRDGLPADWLYEYQWEKTEKADLPRPGEEAGHSGGRWLLFADRGGFGDSLARALDDRGASSILIDRAEACSQRGDLTRVLAQTGPAPVRGVVWLRELDGAEDDPGSADGIDALSLVQALLDVHLEPPPRLYLITRGVHSLEEGEAPSLVQALVWGLGRVLMNEHPGLACTLIDLGQREGALPAGRLAGELLAGSPDDEIALRGESRFVHRLTGSPLREEEGGSRAVSMPSSHPFVVDVATRGSVESLRFRESERRPPEHGEVELRIHVAGLNFKDILKILGLLSEKVLEGTYYGRNIGMEAAATVVGVGAGVEALKAGDEIVANINRGCFRSYVTIPVDELCWVPKLKLYSASEQAAMPVAFVTALYGLHEIGRLQAGERVLLHSAAGGVGLAAVQVARWLGAEIFATAGKPQKRDYLRSLGIEHVLDSRSLDFADEVMALTGGAGVDVVLNFLTGEGLTKSLSILAPFGRFIEIGKQDIDRDLPLGLSPFNQNLSFSAVDIDRLLSQRPAVSQRLLRDVWHGLEEGYFQPLPVTEYPLTQLEEACRHMMQATHIGKIAVALDDLVLPVHPRDRNPPLVVADATYLITGGLGGFGLAVAEWMVEQGAGNLVLMGRHGAAAPEAQQAVRALREKGARIVAAAVDVTDSDQLAASLREIEATMPPLRGVLHAAMVLDDGLLADLEPARVHRVLAPKVRGAWNLHRLTEGAALDFFVLFSSVSSLVGNPGQGSYAAANAFLDNLAHYRRARGLPAMSINWGVLSEVGVAAREPGLLEHLQRIGMRPFTPAEAVVALGRLLRLNPVQIGVMDIDWQRWAQTHPAAAGSPRFSQLVQTAAEAAPGPLQPLIRSLAALPREIRLAEVTGLLAAQTAKVLRMPVSKLDVHQPLTQMGVDSLLAVELQLAIRQGSGVEYSVLELLKGMSLTELAAQTLDRMVIPESPASSGGPLQEAPEPAADPAVLVDDLSDEEVNDMLIELLQSNPIEREQSPWPS